MTDDRVEVVRRMYDAFHAGDFEPALALFDPDAVIDSRARVDGDVSRGRDAVARIVGRWTAAFDDWREEIEELRAVGDRVLVVSTQYARAKDSGIEAKTRYAVVYEVAEGAITAMTLFLDPAAAERAALA